MQEGVGVQEVAGSWGEGDGLGDRPREPRDTTGAQAGLPPGERYKAAAPAGRQTRRRSTVAPGGPPSTSFTGPGYGLEPMPLWLDRRPPAEGFAPGSRLCPAVEGGPAAGPSPLTCGGCVFVTVLPPSPPQSPAALRGQSGAARAPLLAALRCQEWPLGKGWPLRAGCPGQGCLPTLPGPKPGPMLPLVQSGAPPTRHG